MSDVPDDLGDLEPGDLDEPTLVEIIHQLDERLTELESPTTATEDDISNQNGLDSRDASVIEQLEHGQTYTRRQIVQFYTTHTDIRQSSTAKRRAKTLVGRGFFQAASGGVTYRGE